MILEKRKKGRGVFGELHKNRQLYSMFIPGMIILFLFSYLPMFGTMIAFKKYNYRDGVFGSPWVGFKNFEFLFKGPRIVNITTNTVVYNLIFIVLGLIIPILLAVLITESRNKRAGKFYQSAMLLPYFLSWVVVSYIAYAFLNTEQGLVNAFLKNLGGKPVDWYGEPDKWRFLIPFFNSWKYAGYNTVIYIATITGIDQELYEAAAVDGAKKIKQIWYITLPGIKPMAIVLTILAVGRIFTADFGLFYQVTRNSPLLKSATSVLDVFVYNTLMVTGDIGMSSAAALYQSVVGFVLILTANAIVRRLDKDSALM